MARVGSGRTQRLIALSLALAFCTAGSLRAEEVEQDVRDKVEASLKVKAALNKTPAEQRKLINDISGALMKEDPAKKPVTYKVLLESIILLGTQSEDNLDVARTAASMWAGNAKLPTIDCHEFYIGCLRNLRDKVKTTDKESLAYEMFWLRNDEIGMYVKNDDLTNALRLAGENKNFTDTFVADRDIKDFALDILNGLQRKEKLDKRKQEIKTQLEPDADAPAANAAVASFYLFDSADLSAAMPFMLKSTDPLLVAYAQLRRAQGAKVPLGWRDLFRLGEIAYQLSKKAASDDSRIFLLGDSLDSFDAAAKHPDAKNVVDANKFPMPLSIKNTQISKVQTDLNALKRKSANRADDLTYLFSHVGLRDPPSNPLGKGWEYKLDKDNEWSPNGAVITFIRGDKNGLVCKSTLQGDFTLSFDIQPIKEQLDPNKDTIFWTYFNNGQRAGLLYKAKDAQPRITSDFGGPQPPTQPFSGFLGWTHWEVKQKAGVVSLVVNNRQIPVPTTKLANPLAGNFAFGAEPPVPFKVRNVRLRDDN